MPINLTENINNANKQFFRDQIEELQKIYINNDELYVFNPKDVSEEEIEELKTTLFCCNTEFFLNKNNIDYNNAENLSNAVSVLQDKLTTDAVSLKLIAQGNNATKINITDHITYYYLDNIDTQKKIISGLLFEDELQTHMAVSFYKDRYSKYFDDNNQKKRIGHCRKLEEGNQLHIMHGEFIFSAHTKGTYIIISKNQIKLH